MDISEVLENLKDYKKSGGNWFKMADLILQISRSDAWLGHYPSNAAWLKEAAKISGYSPTVVRRMLRVRDFLNRMVVKEGLILPEDADIPLASLEVLERMYPLGPERVTQILGRAIRGQATLREVQREYDDLVSKKPEEAGETRLLPRLTRAFEERAFEAVLENMILFSGKGNFHTIRKFNGPLGLTVDVLAIGSDPTTNNVIIDGFEFKFVSTNNYLGKNRFSYLAHITCRSEFFRRYWLIFPEGPGMQLGEMLRNDLKLLGLYNVGVAILKDEVKSAPTEDLWDFLGSVYRPEICTPKEEGFFPNEDEYNPKWSHLLLEHIGSKTLGFDSQKQ